MNEPSAGPHQIKILSELHRLNMGSAQAKSIVRTATFYAPNPESEDFSELQHAARGLKEEGVISEYSIKSGSKEISEEEVEGQHGYLPASAYDVHFLEIECSYSPQRVANYLTQLSLLPLYFVRLIEDSAERKLTLTLNDTYVLAHPRYGGPAHGLIQVMLAYSRRELTRDFIIKTRTQETHSEFSFGSRRMDGVLADLGFKGELKKIFLPHTSWNAIYFRNDILKVELEGQKIGAKRLAAQLERLHKILPN